MNEGARWFLFSFGPPIFVIVLLLLLSWRGGRKADALKRKRLGR